MNPYQILGIASNATEEEIKNAYRKLAKQNHPDLHSDTERESYEAKMKQINEAYNLALKNAANKSSKNNNQSVNNSNKGFKRQSAPSNYVFLYTEIFNEIMKNTEIIENLLNQMSELVKNNNNEPINIISRMRYALSQYYDRVKKYKKYTGKTHELSRDEIYTLDHFIDDMVWKVNPKYAYFLTANFVKVLKEELFPLLKFTGEYQELMKELNNIILENKKDMYAVKVSKVLQIVESSLIGFINRSQILYNANPMCKDYDNNDEYLNYLASRFYMKCLMESADYDIFSALSQKNAFDDFIKEEASKDNKGPKLKLTKENKE